MRPRSEGRRCRGTALVLVTICLVPMICVMGLVLDGGLMLAKKRHDQAGADAAARAAACSLNSRYASESGLDPQGKAAVAGRAPAPAPGPGPVGPGPAGPRPCPPLTPCPPL